MYIRGCSFPLSSRLADVEFEIFVDRFLFIYLTLETVSMWILLRWPWISSTTSMAIAFPLRSVQRLDFKLKT
jgi:hypothetical protein